MLSTSLYSAVAIGEEGKVKKASIFDITSVFLYLQMR
jgi:hypothetical protein